MKLPKRRRRVVAVEAPRMRRTGRPGQGSISGGPGGRNGEGKSLSKRWFIIILEENHRYF